MNNNPNRPSKGYSGKLVWGLVVVILLLAAFLAYIFFIGPSITGYVVDRQIEAQQILVSNIVAQVQQQGFVQIPLSENETLILVPYQAPVQGPDAGNVPAQ